jgi:hypothetical protein
LTIGYDSQPRCFGTPGWLKEESGFSQIFSLLHFR